tara:strand:- start:2074 stop:2589 length:516 start_codon:yes stop_codon:yes gene_type:complete
MANARRVIYSSYVIPIETETSEEGFVHSKLDTTTNIKKFAGKGNVPIAADQVNDEWVSFFHPQDANWEDRDTPTDDIWQNQYTLWDGTQSITNGSTTRIREQDTVDIDFLYIKNTGSSNTATLSLNDIGYDILIPPGAAVSMRVNDIGSDKIKVDTVSGATTIEYIIAKTS